jgi:hypothetical protein
MTLALLSLLAVVVLCGAFLFLWPLRGVSTAAARQVTQRHLLYAASKALAAFLAARSAVTIARRVARCLSGWAGREFGACSIGLFDISRDEAGWSQTV